MSTIGILALQGDFQAHADVLSKIGVPWRLVRSPSDLDGLAGLIIPGGESSTFLKLIEEEHLWQPLRDFAAEHAVFGTCAGAILMADKVKNPSQASLGLIRMTIERNAYGRQLSSSIRQAEAAPELNSGDEAGDETGDRPKPRTAPPLEVVLIRAPIITEVGPDVEVLAAIDGKPLAVRQGRYMAATFHPELTTDTRTHCYFARLVSEKSSAGTSTKK